MKKSYWIAALIVVALIFIKIKFFGNDKVKAAGLPKDGKKPPVSVTVFVVGKDNLENKVFANATIVANEEAELKTEASGRVVYLNLPEGKTVKAGTLLLKINDAEYKAQLAKIAAQLKLANQTETSLRKLLEIQGINKQDHDIAVANLNGLKADSTYLCTQIAKTEIYAPFTGVIGIRNISIGSYITPATLVAIIHQIDPIKIEFSLPEKYLPFFKIGDKLHFKTEGVDKDLTANIAVKDPQVDEVSRSIRYRALTENNDANLFPGAFARVELVVKETEKTLFVPTEAIVPVAKGKKLFVVKNGIAEDRLVESGIRTEDFIQVISGIQIGDSVVVNGNFQLKKGSAVKVRGNAKGGDKDKDKKSDSTNKHKNAA